ncbi:MAG: hypothetical protein L0323_03110 [Planctomycetes bacterium]|nr:hypothetical protein [Planctomycetota bacterium]
MAPWAFLPLLLQQVWVVDDDGGPGVNFTDLPPAIAAAADGDTLLVRAGSYTPFTLSGKGLRILGESSVTTLVAGGSPTLVTAIPATSVVYIDRIRFLPAVGATSTLEVSGTTTRAVLAYLTSIGPFGGAAVSVVDAEVHVHRSSFFGSSQISLFNLPGRGLDLGGGARAHIATTTISGGSGLDNGYLGPLSPASGAIGVAVSGTAAAFWIADSFVQGGAGGWGTCSGASNPPNGGHGIASTSAGRVSGLPSTLVRGGNAGTGQFCTVLAPSGGYGVIAPASATVHSITLAGGNASGFGTYPGFPSTGGVVTNATPLPVLRITSSLPSLTLTGSATVDLSNGPPGAPYLIAISPSPGFQSGGPLFLGEILLDPANWFPLFAGTLSASGDFSVTVPLTGISPNFAYFPLFLQGMALDPGGSFWRVSNATVVTLRP